LKHNWHDEIGKRPHEAGIMSLELMTIGETLKESTDDSVSAFARSLDFALFDLQRACVWRLILKFFITVVNCTLTLDHGAVFDDPPDSTSPIGFFHRPDSQAENVLQYTRRNRTNWPLLGPFNVPERKTFTCTIRADRSGKIPITITRNQNTLVPIEGVPVNFLKPGPLEFVAERYRNDTDRLIFQTFQLPGNVDSVVHTDEQKFTLDLAPSKDFWWPQ
jgi:hypothetical protein